MVMFSLFVVVIKLMWCVVVLNVCIVFRGGFLGCFGVIFII